MNSIFAIKVNSLTKTFGNFTAVNSISFNINKGEIFGFLGANGAGKTTAIKMLCGIMKPTSGDAIVNEFSVTNETEKVKNNIGYMSQKFSLYEDLTVKENIKFFGGIYGLPIDIINERTDLLLNKLEMKNDAKSIVGSLPLGWKQKIAFSVASLHNPAIIFLDEPTSGVDPITRRQFWELIYETAYKGTTILITTHYMEEAEYCNRILIMVDGKIETIGTPSEIKYNFNTKNIDEVFVKLARK